MWLWAETNSGTAWRRLAFVLPKIGQPAAQMCPKQDPMCPHSPPGPGAMPSSDGEPPATHPELPWVTSTSWGGVWGRLREGHELYSYPGPPQRNFPTSHELLTPVTVTVPGKENKFGVFRQRIWQSTVRNMERILYQKSLPLSCR